MKLLVTGATGFIGKHVVKAALAAGHEVRASLRDPARADEVRAAVGHDDIEFVALDLLQDAGWQAALASINGLLHTASPVPISDPADPAEVIRPAVEGTRRAVMAAAANRVPKVVVTSSSAAVMGGPPKPDGAAFTPADWTDPDAPQTRAYARSKTLAERCAREIAAAHPEMSLATVNPSVVIGAPLDGVWASSLVLIERLLEGTDPVLPRLAFSTVAIGDVAEAHIRALDAPDGARILAATQTLWIHDIARIMRDAEPTTRAARRVAPDWVIRLLGRFDPVIGRIAEDLGDFRRTDTGSLETLLGRPPTPVADAIAEAARALAARMS